MTGVVEGPKQTSKSPPVARLRGLSGKVLTLAIVFVMIGEILIFLPSLANYRVTWLKGRIAMAEVAALAVEAAPDNQISDDLRKELLALMGHAPEESELRTARRLFARALEARGGLKIHTIHGFCERLLQRFPLEAQVTPHFKVLDERGQAAKDREDG